MLYLGGEIYTFGSLSKEQDKLKEEYDKLDERSDKLEIIKDKLIKDYNKYLELFINDAQQMKLELKRNIVLADAYIVTLNKDKQRLSNTDKQRLSNTRRKILNFLKENKELILDRTINLYLDNIYYLETDYDGSIELLSNYINTYINKYGEILSHSSELGDIYYDRACSYCRKYSEETDGTKKDELKNLIIKDIKSVLRCNPETVLQDFEKDDDQDFKDIINKEWFKAIFNK